MGAVVDFLVSKVLETLYDMGKEELGRQLSLGEDLKKLQRTLGNLRNYLHDAEKKSIESDSMKEWLYQIKNVIYDIEDLFEEYSALKLNNNEIISSNNDEASSSSSKKVRCCFPIQRCFKKAISRHSICVQLESLNKRLTYEIMSQIPQLNLISSIPNETSDSVANQIAPNQPTTHMRQSVLVNSDIVGNRIHDEAKLLIELLIKEDDRDNPLVYAITGMGGIGKTTLAKLVFHDQMIENSFQVKAWVHVSENYNDSDILRKIKISAMQTKSSMTSIFASGDEHNHHLNSLEDVLHDKRIFIVLDNMWETNKRIWNELLRDTLKNSVAKGSRVLITTRNIEIANQMMAVHSHKVESLPEEDGWSLLCKSAFPAWEEQKAKDDVWNLKDIGIELVRKCNGLPLAINVIGGILSSQQKEKEAWELVLQSNVWEVKGLPQEIHSALHISYRHLPANIKQCFLTCSLFPKGEDFYIWNAESLLIQEGLINDELNMHDVAKSYLRILVQRNLLIPAGKEYFRMHDVVYSLARFLTQNENLVATAEKEILNYRGSTMKARRLSFIGDKDKTTNILPTCLQEQVSLRTLLIFDKTICKIDNDLFNHLPYLRILWLEGTNVTELPASIYSLKLLKYLNLTRTPIRELPVTIQNLKTLRILDVSGCVNLRELPACIMNLHNLYYLITDGSGLDRLPPGLSKLNKLQHLEFTLPQEDIERESSTIKDLATLTELRYLYLYKLERVTLDRSQAQSKALKDKQHLETLHLRCSKKYSNEEISIAVSNIIEDIFEDLCPPLKLKILIIENYFGSKLPSWLGSPPTCKNVRELILICCSKCDKFKGLGLLPYLDELYIEGASSIKSIGSEFYTNNMEQGASRNSSIYFKSLKKLSFIYMNSWEEWSSLGETISVMPNLECLTINRCPKLKSFPKEILHHAANSLKEIKIYHGKQLQLKEVHDLPCLEIFEIRSIPYLERISGLPMLQQLKIKNCLGINNVELAHTLQNIYWVNFNADSLPKWLFIDEHEDYNNIKAIFLIIKCKEELVRKICSNDETGFLVWSKIQHFTNISVWNENKCLRYTKTPLSFTVHAEKEDAIIPS